MEFMNNDTLKENLPAELNLPPMKNIFKAEFLHPLLIYYGIFHILGRIIGKIAWQSMPQFK